MILGLEFPPISHVVEWPTSSATAPSRVNKVVLLMWISALIAFGVMFLGGRKQALVPTGVQNVAESAVDFVEDGIVLQTIGPDGPRGSRRSCSRCSRSSSPATSGGSSPSRRCR